MASASVPAAAAVAVPGPRAAALSKPVLTLPSSLAHARLDPRHASFSFRLPEEYRGCGPLTSTLRVCVSEAGTVGSVSTLGPSLPALDQRLLEAVGNWRYRPYVVNERPQAFCYLLRLSVG
jgi:hypothetical protein